MCYFGLDVKRRNGLANPNQTRTRGQVRDLVPRFFEINSYVRVYSRYKAFLKIGFGDLELPKTDRNRPARAIERMGCLAAKAMLARNFGITHFTVMLLSCTKAGIS
jgi:hypothetical protein